MENLIINVLFPLYLLIFIGYLIGRIKPDARTNTISTIVIYVFAPALIFHSFRKISLNAQNLTCMFTSALSVFVLVFLISVLAEKLFLKMKNEAFELSTTVMNAGYLGIPLIYLMFGEKGLPYALSFMVAMAVYHFSLGIAILQKENFKSTVISAVKIPLLPALIFSLLLKNVFLPPGILKMIEMSGNASLPLMLVSIGISLSKIVPKELKIGVIATVVRFFGGTIAALLTVSIIPCPTTAKKVIIVQSSLPSAILNYVLCEKFKKSPQTAATIIFISTLLFPLYLLLIKNFL